MKAIAFVGAHSSGKSTLIDAYVTAHPNSRITIIHGLTRAIIERGFPLAKDSTVDSYANYIRDQLRAERNVSHQDFDLLLSDRTVLDATAYARVNSELPRPFVPSYFIEMLLEVALLEAVRFDLFVYCPVEFPMEPAAWRPSDERYRQQVGTQIKAFLEEHSLPHIVACGDVQARLLIINRAIDSLNG